jgi:hypothetical protein
VHRAGYFDEVHGRRRRSSPGPGGFLDRIPEAGGLSDWITAQQLDHHVDELTRNCCTATLKRFRCLDRNWKLTEAAAAETIAVPSLFIGGAADLHAPAPGGRGRLR